MSTGDDGLQLDPAIRQELLLRSGSPDGPAEGESSAGDLLPVVVRLDPFVEVPGLRVVARFGAVATGRVRLADVLAVRRHPAVRSLKASRVYGPALAVSVPEVRATAADLRQATGSVLTGRGVVVAVLDWGLDVGHANLRRRDGSTRVLALWDQRGGRTSTSPEPLGYGRVIDAAAIDAALRTADPYAALRYDPAEIDPQGEGTHGTHVADIAVGNGRARGSAPGMAPEADLLFVHLRGDDTRPEDTLGDSARLLEAVSWAVQRAAGRPLVLHASLGRTGGPHDASPLVVRALDHLLATVPGVAMVMSCGNYGDARMHSSLRVAPGARAELDWDVPAPGPTGSELELWYPSIDRLHVALLAPDGHTVFELPLGEHAVVREEGRLVASGFHRRQEPNSGSNHVDLFLQAGASPGTWRVVLTGADVRDGRVEAWIERTSARYQSRFPRRAAVAERTTGSICNGWLPLAVGAYDARAAGRPAMHFTSRGPTRDDRRKPDVSAPGAGVIAARSAIRRPDGSRGLDGVVAKSGTSMAAPHVSGAVALVFQAVFPRRLPMAVTRWILLETARRDPPRTATDALLYGAGRLDARAACALATALTHEPSAEAIELPALAGVAAAGHSYGGGSSLHAGVSAGSSGEADDEPSGGATPTADLSVAASEPTQAFSAAAVVLAPDRAVAAARWNAQQHPSASGVPGAAIASRVAAYVDVQACAAAAAAAQVPAGTPPFDAGTVEALRQLQARAYAEASEADGRAGPSTLDTLGLVRRGRFNPAARANTFSQRRLDRMQEELRRATDGEFTAGTWWEGMVDPAWLGRRFTNGIHLVLARRLRLAERELVRLPAYADLWGAALGTRVGITERHRGYRPTARTYSMHTFGLAVDVEYGSNPWIVGQAVDGGARPSPAGLVTRDANRTMTEVVNRAALLVGGEVVEFDGGYLHRLSQGSTEAAWDDLRRRHDQFCEYLRCAGDPALAEPHVTAGAGVPGVSAVDEPVAVAARRWSERAAADLGALRAGAVRRTDSTGAEITVARSNFAGRDPRAGFLTLNRDLVVALRDRAGLAWGAIDFGPRESGDMMHFDCRRDGVGSVLLRA